MTFKCCAVSAINSCTVSSKDFDLDSPLDLDTLLGASVQQSACNLGGCIAPFPCIVISTSN